MLLQTIASSRLTGLLTIESDKGNMAASFTNGVPNAARLNRVKGKEALLEFLIAWNEGLFSFQECSADMLLPEECRFNYPISRLLLDGALLTDILVGLLANLPNGEETVLARVWNFEQAFHGLAETKLLLADESEFPKEKLAQLFDLAANVDGLSTIEEVLAQSPDWSRHKALQALSLLVERGLLLSQSNELTSFLAEFRKLTEKVDSNLGKEDGKKLLCLSLELTQSNDTDPGLLFVNGAGAPDLQLSKFRQEGLSVLRVLEVLREWRSNYTVCLRRLNRTLAERLEELQGVEGNGV
jgi:hypothetical protein